ncbi:beta-xylosidase [Saccharopolyspora gloriosae]|uniref:beta-xylosidase n=1 Tax=Saccharopolyspora gloriosae TaxID=455344 RepID=UPI001FB85689|nr:beta-xylosidase [Saccharopolyspora gloriosae]
MAPLGVVFVLSAACAPGTPPLRVEQPAERSLQTTTLRTANERSSESVVASGGNPAPYNYGPTVLAEPDGEGMRYRAWWCSQLPSVAPAGDDVLFAESGDLQGEFDFSGAPAVPVFTGEPGAFDGKHTCDPSVLRTGGRFHLYYTGAAGEHAHGNAIGVASSDDGRAWRREAGGDPIVRASGEVRRDNDYGAGQPSALFLDGWFYLMLTDTTASGAGWNGAGQFVLRARDAEFSDRVQALTDSGFEPTGTTNVPRRRSVVDAFSADWMWSDALRAFAIAHQTERGTTITFWDRDFTGHPYAPLLLPGPWREGPGLVRTDDGHTPTSTSDPCGTVPVDLLRATESNPAPTSLHSFGLDVPEVHGCADPDRARGVLEAFGVPSPQRTVDVVRGGRKVSVERRSVAETMVRRVLDERIPALEAVPAEGTIRAGAPVLRSPAGELAIADDHGRMWTIGPDTAEANGSPVSDTDQRTWNSRPHTGDLR